MICQYLMKDHIRMDTIRARVAMRVIEDRIIMPDIPHVDHMEYRHTVNWLLERK